MKKKRITLKERIVNKIVYCLFCNKQFSDLLAEFVWLNFASSCAKRNREVFGIDVLHRDKETGCYYWDTEDD